MTLDNKQNTMFKELDTELKIKRREARREYKSHFGAAEHYRKLHKTYGSIAIICGVIAGSAFFAEASHVFPFLKYFASFLTLVAACLTVLITYNRYLELSTLHDQSAHKWEKLRDEYEVMIIEISHISSDSELDDLFNQYRILSDKRQKVRNETISIPGWLFHKYEKIVDKTELEKK